MSKKIISDVYVSNESYVFQDKERFTVRSNQMTEKEAIRLKKQIDHGLSVIKHIETMIKKCDIEIDVIRSGNEAKPPQMIGDPESNAIWDDIMEERLEYLESLQSKLLFILKYPEREQVV